MSKVEISHVETSRAPPGPTHASVNAKTVVALAAISFISVAQLAALLGTGLLAEGTATFLGDASMSAWFSQLLTIVSLALAAPIAEAANYWGRRWFLIGFMAAGFVGSIIISRAQNIATAFVGFVFLGMSIGAQPLLFAVVSEILPRKYRAWGQASMNTANGLAAVYGILVASALNRHNEYGNFRIFWYTMAAIFLVGVTGLFLGYNPPPRDDQQTLTALEKLRKLDWIAYLLLATGLTLLCVGLQWSYNPYTWRNAHVLAPLITGLVLLISFLIYSWKIKKDGFLHHELFRHRNFAIGLFALFVDGLSFFTGTNYFVYELIVVYQLNSFDAGLRFLLMGIATMVSAAFVGWHTTMTRTIRLMSIIGFLCLLLYNIFMITLCKPSISSIGVWFYVLPAGVATVAIMNNGMVAAQLCTPRHMISQASTLLITLRSLGGAIGLAIYPSIINSKLANSIGSAVAEAVLPLGIATTELEPLIAALMTGDVDAALELEGITPQIIKAARDGLSVGYAHAFEYAWIASACFAGIGVCVAYFYVDPKDEFNTHIDAPLQPAATTQIPDGDKEQQTSSDMAIVKS